MCVSRPYIAFFTFLVILSPCLFLSFVNHFLYCPRVDQNLPHPFFYLLLLSTFFYVLIMFLTVFFQSRRNSIHRNPPFLSSDLCSFPFKHSKLWIDGNDPLIPCTFSLVLYSVCGGNRVEKAASAVVDDSPFARLNIIVCVFFVP